MKPDEVQPGPPRRRAPDLGFRGRPALPGLALSLTLVRPLALACPLALLAAAAQAAPDRRGLGEVAPLPADDGRSQTPWGPGRRRSGEHFRSTAEQLAPGPFRVVGDDWSLALTLQYIGRSEARWDRDFNDRVGDDQLVFDQRARVGVQAAWQRRLGLLVELQDVRPWGVDDTTTRTVPLTGVHQAFADLWVCAGFEVRVGRQELSYGDERLLGSLDWGQHARAFDGALARLTPLPELTVDLLGMRVADQAPVGSGPSRVTGAWFTGAYGRWRPGMLDLDLYSLYLNDPDTRAQARGAQTLLTVGARAVSRVGGLTLTGEFAAQYGRTRAEDAVSERTINALAGAARGAYVFDVAGRPYLGAEVAVASGGGEGDDDHTFRQLFPTGHAHLGFADLVGWQNVEALKLTGGLRPWGTHLWVDVWRFQKASADDAWYHAGGGVLQPARPPGARGSGDQLGTEIDVSWTLPVNEAAAFALGYALFLPGDAAVTDSPSHWTFASLRTQL